MDNVKQRAFQYAEQFLGVGALGLILVGCFVVLRPFVSVILWAAILCYATWPACEWLVRHLRGRRTAAALIMTLGLVAVVALPVALVGSSLAVNLDHLMTAVRRLSAEGLPTPPAWVTSIPYVGDHIDANWSDLALNADRTAAMLKRLLANSQGWLVRNSLHVAQGVLQVCLSVVVAFFFYRDGHYVARRSSEMVERIVGGYTQHLIEVAEATVRGVVYGILGTALGQGIMAAIGFSIVGLPAALFWALVVSLFSFLPFGPPIIWMAATAWLAIEGSTGWAVFMAVWGLVGISGIDNVLRPILISRNAKLSFLPALLGVMGGLLAFGLIGVFLGPTLLAVGLGMAKEFAHGGHRGLADAVASGTPPAETSSDSASAAPH